MLTANLLNFLQELSLNNNKAWFEENRKWYDSARAEFVAFVKALIAEISGFDNDISGLESKHCIFRINRDVRFSKNKAPYKTNMGASFDRGGKKSVFAGYYMHIEPGKSFVGGGIWMPAPEEIKKIRQEIDYNWEEFQAIIKEKNFKKTYKDLYKGSDISLVNIPKDYEKTNPAANYLRLKSWLAMREISDAELVSADFLRSVVRDFKALMPLNKFINRAIE